MPLAYVESGSGRPLVLLPSVPGDARLYADLVARPLGRVVAVDPPGFGRSAPMPEAPNALTAETYATLVGDLIATLGLERPVIGGTGFGGYVALELAARRGLDLAGLVIVGCVPAPDPPAKAPIREALATAALTHGLRAVADEQVGRSLVPSAGVRVRAAFRSMIEDADPRGLAALARGMMLRPDPVLGAAQINVPTLVIAGGLDPFVSPEAVRRLADAIPGARFASVPAGGHQLALERPAAFRRLLGAFLGELG